MRLLPLLSLLLLEATLCARLARYYKIPSQDAKEVDGEKSATCLLKAYDTKPSAPAFVVKMNGECELIQKMDGYFDFYFPNYPGAMLYVKVNDTDPRDFPNLSEEEQQYVINDYLPRRRKEHGIKCSDEEVKTYIEESKELTVKYLAASEICVVYMDAKQKVAQREYLPVSVVKAFDRMGITVFPPIFQTIEMRKEFDREVVGNQPGQAKTASVWTGYCKDETGAPKLKPCSIQTLTDDTVIWPAVCSFGTEPNMGECNLASGFDLLLKDKNLREASMQVGFYYQFNQ